jgi:hypothetical protein
VVTWQTLPGLETLLFPEDKKDYASDVGNKSTITDRDESLEGERKARLSRKARFDLDDDSHDL